MKNNYSIAERNRIVEENLHWIDRTIRRNTGLMQAAHLDYDDVYQDLAIRLIRCVESYDPEKGELMPQTEVRPGPIGRSTRPYHSHPGSRNLSRFPNRNPLHLSVPESEKYL